MKVIVGLSGGVDSAVAAYLLKEQNYEVIGVSLLQIDSVADSIEDAAKVAEHLGIRHEVIDVTATFKKDVIDYFVDEYLHARTPNPCVVCNKVMKFRYLYEAAGLYGADYVATGHYANVIRLDNGRYTLRKNHEGKDQTYALCNLTSDMFAKLLTPLSDYSKDEIRKMASEIGLPVASKPDSQDICFVPDNDYAGFITEHYPECVPKAGDFVDEEGKVLGRHKGIIYYTIGQRKGLNLALNRPVYVKEIKADTNEVVISTDSDVFFGELICNMINPIGLESIEDGTRFTAKIRYADKGSMCTFYNEGDNTARVIFDDKARAVTPGQTIAFYKDDILMAGARIVSGKCI